MNGPENTPTPREKALVELLHLMADEWERSGKKAKERCARDVRRGINDYYGEPTL